MDKGIRPYAINKFRELNAQRVAGELCNRRFRKTIMIDLQENFGITNAASATAYNTAFKALRAEAPKDYEGLGRPEDKKGGRKKKEVTPKGFVDAESIVPKTFNVCKKKDGAVVAENLSFEQATELVAKAKTQKKALYWI